MELPCEKVLPVPLYPLVLLWLVVVPPSMGLLAGPNCNTLVMLELEPVLIGIAESRLIIVGLEDVVRC